MLRSLIQMTMPGANITASVLIVTRNNSQTLAECLRASLALDFPASDFEVIVYDDCSDAPQRELLRELQTVHQAQVARGGLRVILGETRLGLGRGRNAAAREARGRILFYLDGDAYPDPSWIRAALPSFAEDMVGISASCVVMHRCRTMINGVGATLNWFATGLDHHIFQPIEESPRVGQYVLYAMGCGLVTSRACWEAIGGFDPAIMNYYDDADYGIRAWGHGFKVVTAPTARVYHDNTSLAGGSPGNIFLNDLGRWRIMLKHWPLSMIGRSALYQLHLVRRVLPVSRWAPLARAFGAVLRELPSLLRYRASRDHNAPHAYFRWLDARHAHAFSSLAFDARLVAGEEMLLPFRDAVPTDRRHFLAIGALAGPPFQTLINHGRLSCALFPETTALLFDYEHASAGVHVSVQFESAAAESARHCEPLDAAQGRLRLHVPPGSTRCILQIEAGAGHPCAPLFPRGVVTLVRAYQT